MKPTFQAAASRLFLLTMPALMITGTAVRSALAESAPLSEEASTPIVGAAPADEPGGRTEDEDDAASVYAVANGAASDIRCGDRRQWIAEPREWMDRGDGWCSVEVHVSNAGGTGDAKVVISARDRSRRAALRDRASADLPANGGESTPFQFVFPCPPSPAEAFCLTYDAADARGFSYDYLELGANATPLPKSGGSEDAASEGGPAPNARTAVAGGWATTEEISRALLQSTASARDIVPAAPEPRPLGRLRRRTK
jgi:hypothetical protein